MFGTRSDSECVSYTRVGMPSFAPTALRPVFASWLNERSCRLPMSVTIAILKLLGVVVATVVVGDDELLPPPQPEAITQMPVRRTRANVRPRTPARYEIARRARPAGRRSAQRGRPAAERPPRGVLPRVDRVAHRAVLRRRRPRDAVAARRALE